MSLPVPAMKSLWRIRLYSTIWKSKRGTEGQALPLTEQLFFVVFFFSLRDKPPQNHNFLRASHHSWQCWSFFFSFFLYSKDCDIHPQWFSHATFIFPKEPPQQQLLFPRAFSNLRALISLSQKGWAAGRGRGDMTQHALLDKWAFDFENICSQRFCTGLPGKPLAGTIVVLHMLSSSLASFAW